MATYSGDNNFNASASAAVSLTVNGVTTSNLTISPSSVNFGQVLLGSLALKSVTLTNTGTTAITITYVARSKTGVGDFGDFYSVNFCPRSLRAHKSCTLEVAYVPNRDEVGGATVPMSIIVTDSAAGSPQSIPVSAVTINPQASLRPNPLSFGDQKVGTTSGSKSITLANTGTTPLVLNSVGISGNFALATDTTCKSGTTLAPEQQCTIKVTFTPAAKRLRVGAVTITDNALCSTQIVPLRGTGN